MQALPSLYMEVSARLRLPNQMKTRPENKEQLDQHTSDALAAIYKRLATLGQVGNSLDKRSNNAVQDSANKASDPMTDSAPTCFDQNG